MFSPLSSPRRIKPPLGVRLNRGHPLAKGLVARYLFNENGGQTLYDIAGNNHGALTNGPAWAPGQPGKVGAALRFDGTNDYVQTPFVGLSSSAAFTISFWLKRNAVGTTAPFLSAYDSNSLRLDIQPYSDNFIYIIFGAPYAYYSYSAVTWTQFAVVFDGAASPRLKLYIDTFVQTVAGSSGAIPATTTAISSGLQIGRTGETGGVFGAGLIDDIRIYNRALLPDEVKQLYLDPYCDMERQRGAIKYFLPSVVASSSSGGVTPAWLRRRRRQKQGTLTMSERIR